MVGRRDEDRVDVFAVENFAIVAGAKGSAASYGETFLEVEILNVGDRGAFGTELDEVSGDAAAAASGSDQGHVDPFIRTLGGRWKEHRGRCGGAGEEVAACHFDQDSSSPLLLPTLVEVVAHENRLHQAVDELFFGLKRAFSEGRSGFESLRC